MAARKNDTKTQPQATERTTAAAPPIESPPLSSDFERHAVGTINTIAANLGIPADELELQPTEPERNEAGRIRLALPFGDVDPKLHYKRHVELKLSHAQAVTLARIQKLLRGQPYELNLGGDAFDDEGRIIDGPAKVFYWLLNGAALMMNQAAQTIDFGDMTHEESASLGGAASGDSGAK